MEEEKNTRIEPLIFIMGALFILPLGFLCVFIAPKAIERINNSNGQKTGLEAARIFYVIGWIYTFAIVLALLIFLRSLGRVAV